MYRLTVDWLPKDVVRKTDAFMQYAYIAAEEALKQSGVEIICINKKLPKYPNFAIIQL